MSVLRAGETMEPALREVCKDVKVGKILIQTNVDSGEPEVNNSILVGPRVCWLHVVTSLGFRFLQLHYLRLPRDIRDMHVLLLDATVATGAAAMMAVRVLLDHDVPEENIMLLSLIMAAQGSTMSLFSVVCIHVVVA